MTGTLARRHRALVGAIVLLAVALAIAAAALLDRERAMQQLTKEQVYWSVAQAEIELYRFVAALEAHGRGDPATGHDDVVRRYDIFWSRMRLFEAGDVASRVRAFPGAVEALAAARDVMVSEEPAVMAVDEADNEEIGRLHRRFDEAGLALHRLAVAVNQGETAMLAALREELRTEIMALVAIVGGMVSGGSVLVMLLVRENRRSRELALANRQFAAAADASERGVVLCRRQGDLLVAVYANEPFRRLAGDEAIEGAEPSILFSRCLGPAFVAPLEQVLYERRSLVTADLPVERDGLAGWRRLHLTPVEGDGGTLDALMISVEDVDLEVAARREIEAARDAAMRANASKSRFVAVMSHEIRTPMNGVLGALGLIAQRNRDRELDSLIGTARSSGEALLAILNDVLDITRMEAGQLRLDPAPTSLAEIVRSVGAAWQPLAAEKGVALDCTVAAEVPPHVLVDGARLRQMLVNLVANAVKFTDSGQIDIAVTRAGDRAGAVVVRFEVVDSGLGIAAGDRERLFREYDQVTEHGRGGTGLGLAIVRRLADLMGGSVGVDSAVGEGSRFFFELPLAPSAAPVRATPRQALALGGLDVLVAEDNATNRLIVSEILKDLGCRVRVAENGADAIAMAEQAVPDIVLMDIAMPVMDGREAHRRLRAGEGALPALPVVALTAYAMADEVAGFLAEGFDAVLPKPVVREALAETLARLTGRGQEPRGRATPLPGPSATVDRAALEHLLRSLGAETAGHLIESFVADVEQALDRIDAALPGRDLGPVERASHMLAGLAATFGLEGLTIAARAVNTACRANRVDEALEGAARLVVAGRQGLDAFRRLTSEPGFATMPVAATG